MRGRNKNYRYLFLFFVVAIFTFIGSISVKYFLPFNQKEGMEEEKNTSIDSTEKIEKLSMVMVGDNLIHDKIYQYAKTNDGYDFRPILKEIKPIVEK